ncbi:nucleotidyltransferase domain-containing protein [Halosimplex rubrum]|uniref:Nucleotidyltransferase domain-containing protein n=1 Tax=Halosimplex rubrum TaxID=869889 RepID=A0A7D5P5T1_9EURY|nr:nucleotidyltransferase domain-containing protein [Halosimplex rubrum]QLH79104.1 nucleotidyltransferase domain-containing protein [Halosimplex rubrum]
MDSEVDRNAAGVLVPVPLGEERVFRNQATDDILELLYRNPHEEFGVRQLRELTGHGAQTVDTALDVLGQLDLTRTRRDGNRRLTSINRGRLRKPDDPIAEIPQEEFRDPVKAFTDRVAEEQGGNLVGILLFGSVARGEADRTSDIDIQVIVADDLLQSRREIEDVKREVEGSTFGGERYEFQVLVESVETAEQYGEKLQEIVSEAVTLYSTDRLAELRQVILDG